VQRQAFDAEYVQRLSESDPETQRHFAEYFGGLLEIKLRPRLRSMDLVRDAIQETFVRVLNTLRENGIDNPEALGAFVNTTSNHVLWEMYRHRSRTAEPPRDGPSEEIRPDAALAAEQENSAVREVLAEMPERDGAILRALFIEEQDKEEVCRSLGVDSDYVRVVLFRAKTRFRANWAKRGETKSRPASPLQ
jgi:RNA polymerase sigma-70 factor (ECF subfamily)